MPVIEPSGCRHCGMPERAHYRRWHDGVGWHQWTPPSNGQRYFRMQVRQAERKATKEVGSE